MTFGPVYLVLAAIDLARGHELTTAWIIEGVTMFVFWPILKVWSIATSMAGVLDPASI